MCVGFFPRESFWYFSTDFLQDSSRDSTRIDFVGFHQEFCNGSSKKPPKDLKSSQDFSWIVFKNFAKDSSQDHSKDSLRNFMIYDFFKVFSNDSSPKIFPEILSVIPPKIPQKIPIEIPPRSPWEIFPKIPPGISPKIPSRFFLNSNSTTWIFHSFFRISSKNSYRNLLPDSSSDSSRKPSEGCFRSSI